MTYDKELRTRIVATKLTPTEFRKLELHCKGKGTTISRVLQKSLKKIIK